MVPQPVTSRAVWWGSHRDSCRHHTWGGIAWAEITTGERIVADVPKSRNVRVYTIRCNGCGQQWSGYVGKHGTLVNVGR